MKNLVLYYAAFGLGVIVVIIGMLYWTDTLGHHPTRAYVAFAIGGVLLLAGMIGSYILQPKD